MLLWIEGFEGASTDAGMRTYLDRKYANGVVDSYVEKQTGRFGEDTSVRMSQGKWFHIVISNEKTFIVGWAFKVGTNQWNTADNILIFQDGDGWQLLFRPRSTGTSSKIGLYRGPFGSEVYLDETSIEFDDDKWYYLEFKATIDNTNGSYELKSNGVTVMSGSSVDTQALANDYINRVGITGGSGTRWYYYDDIYVCDTSGTVNNDFLGNRKVIRIDPNGDTVDADWTPQGAGDNYVEVDDGATVDDDSTYVQSDTSTDMDLYEYVNPTAIISIHGVMMNTEVRETDATDYTLKSVCKSGTTVSKDTAQDAVSTYTILNRLLETDPDTGALWTTTGINNAKFGIEVG